MHRNASSALVAAALVAAVVLLSHLGAADAAVCTFPLRGQRFTPCGNPFQGTHSRNSPPDNWQSDNAVDLCAPPGTKVYAVEDGVICAACGFGLDPGRGHRFTLNAKNDQFFYTHLGYIDVKRGDFVTRGQFLGTVGDSNAYPPHLHFGARSANTAKTYLASCVRD